MFTTYMSVEKRKIGNLCEVIVTVYPGLIDKLFKGYRFKKGVYRGDGEIWYDHPSGQLASEESHEIATKIWASEDIEMTP